MVGYMTWNNRVLREGVDGWITDRQLDIQETLLKENLSDEEFYVEFMKQVYDEAAENLVPLPPPSPESTGFCHLIPNTTLINNLGNAIVYKARPNGTDRSLLWIGPSFLVQDINNMERQQIGIHSKDYKKSLLRRPTSR
jgi:hypothetical protein